MPEQHNIALTIGGETKRSRFKPLPVEIDWNALPDASQAFVIAYGLKQYLADGMAGAETEGEAHEGVKERVAKLKSGDLSRTKGEGKAKPDTVESRALKLASAFIRQALKDANLKAENAEQVREAAAELVKAEPKWLTEAKTQLANEAKLKDGEGEATKAVIGGLLAKLAQSAPAE